MYAPHKHKGMFYMTATGETTFTFEGRKATGGFDTTPVPDGDYTLKVMAKKAEVRRKGNTGVPYVSVPFEIQDSASTEGGKNRWVYHMFFLSLERGKNGQIMLDRADQLVGLQNAMGTTIPTRVVTIEADPKAGNDIRSVAIQDGTTVINWLKELDGCTVSAHLKTDPASTDGKYAAKNRISRFIVTDAGADPFDQ